MLFNSIEFLIFFPLVTALYFLLPHAWRWGLLLVASCVFYMFFIPYYIVILFITILIDYFAGIWIERSDGKKKKRYLWFSIISTCLVLFVFKYYNFFIGNFNHVAELIGWNYSMDVLKIVLPIGLSFHTFQSLSYVIEVYRGNQKAEHHFGIYALYVMFYPQLVAGPIERPQNILHQFYEKHTVTYSNFSDGFKLIIWGLFKKVVIADNLSMIVNLVYDSPETMPWYWLLIASYLFAVQIYCDFSGYSDMAIGTARVMGFRLMENFNTPYISTSIREFWSRWHISLSTWFRDYVYIPLGGNRVSEWKMNRNLLVVFAVSGFWHGANWTYVIWGALHGMYLVIENMLRKFSWFNWYVNNKQFFVRLLASLVIFQIVVIGWIFFRAENVTDAYYIIKSIFTLNSTQAGLPEDLQMFGIPGLAWKILLALSFLIYDPLLHNLTRNEYKVGSYLRLMVYSVLAAMILLLGFWGEVEFIYFQF
ncbi:MAG: MBOAT family O-acyltransferase [Flavobacteriales bacterium]